MWEWFCTTMPFCWPFRVSTELHAEVEDRRVRHHPPLAQPDTLRAIPGGDAGDVGAVGADRTDPGNASRAGDQHVVWALAPSNFAQKVALVEAERPVHP